MSIVFNENKILVIFEAVMYCTVYLRIYITQNTMFSGDVLPAAYRATHSVNDFHSTKQNKTKKKKKERNRFFLQLLRDMYESRN